MNMSFEATLAEICRTHVRPMNKMTSRKVASDFKKHSDAMRTDLTNEKSHMQTEASTFGMSHLAA